MADATPPAPAQRPAPAAAQRAQPKPQPPPAPVVASTGRPCPCGGVFERVTQQGVVLAVRCSSCFGDYASALARSTILTRPQREGPHPLERILGDFRSPPRPRDDLARQIPRRLTIGTLLTAAGAHGRVRQVPAANIAEEGMDGDGEYAFVTCSCGAHAVARPVISKCNGCERWYMLAAGRVQVVYGDMTPPAIPRESSDDSPAAAPPDCAGEPERS